MSKNLFFVRNKDSKLMTISDICLNIAYHFSDKCNFITASPALKCDFFWTTFLKNEYVKSH